MICRVHSNQFPVSVFLLLYFGFLLVLLLVGIAHILDCVTSYIQSIRFFFLASKLEDFFTIKEHCINVVSQMHTFTARFQPALVPQVGQLSTAMNMAIH